MYNATALHDPLFLRLVASRLKRLRGKREKRRPREEPCSFSHFKTLPLYKYRFQVKEIKPATAIPGE